MLIQDSGGSRGQLVRVGVNGDDRAAAAHRFRVVPASLVVRAEERAEEVGDLVAPALVRIGRVRAPDARGVVVGSDADLFARHAALQQRAHGTLRLPLIIE